VAFGAARASGAAVDVTVASGASAVAGMALAAGRIRRAVGSAVAGAAAVAGETDVDVLGAGALVGLAIAASVAALVGAGALVAAASVGCSPVCVVDG